MTRRHSRRGRLATLAAAMTIALGAVAACHTDSLLTADDPDLISPADIDNPDGAAGMRLGALSRLRDMTGGTGGSGESPWLYSGLLADEYTSSSTFAQNDETDKRTIQTSNSIVTGHFRDYFRTRTAAMQATLLLRKWLPNNKADIAEMFFVKGFSELSLAQDFCNGIPLSSIVSSNIAVDSIVYGEPLPVAQVFQAAAASFDSAFAILGTDTTAAANKRVFTASRIGKARALLANARTAAEYQAAAALVLGIPTGFGYAVTFVVGTGDNAVWTFTTSNNRYSIGDSVEGNARNLLVKNAIPFLSAKDPRLPASYVTRTTGTRVDTTKGQDGLTYVRVQSRYARSDSMLIVSGIDARLLEAESQLAAGNTAGYLTTMNALRTGPTRVSNGINISGMAALTDPGTPDGRIDQFFRERAFWTFGRGQRLNDLRRLVRNYGRTSDAVFPNGPFHKGGSYGADMNFPIPQVELNNPNVHASCIDRNA